MTKNMMGLDGSYWFIGIVEDNRDPDNNGRVKVRCYGIHSESKTELPTAHLSWFLTAVSTNSSSSDIASIQIGSCVKGIFLDGIDMQIGLVESIIPGYNTHTVISKGFANLKQDAAKEGTATGNPYSRGDKLPDRQFFNDMTSAGGKVIREPKDVRGSVYPHNIASMSDSGHVIERDDTKGKERINIQDKFGSYVEMSALGIVIKSLKDLYNLCINYYQGIFKDRIVSVGGSDYLKIGKGDKVIVIDNGKFLLECKGSTLTIKGTCNLNVDGVLNLSSSSGLNIETEGELNLTGSTVSVNGSLIKLN